MTKRCYLLVFALLISLLSAKAPKTPDLTILGYIRDADGIGNQSIELIKTLGDQLEIGFIHTRPPNYTDVPLSIQQVACARKKIGKVVILEDVLWYPYLDNCSKIRPIDRKQHIVLAYSMLESDRIPSQWVFRLNQYFDAVIVPDPYYANVYRSCGVRIPIFNLPLHLDLSQLLKKPLKSKKNTPFVFGCLSYCEERKNIDKLISGFHNSFGNDPNVMLRINCRGSHADYERKIRQLIQEYQSTNIIFTVNTLNRTKYQELLSSFDCYVSVSQGEGFSIPPREALALGIPVIATDNSAQKTLCKTPFVRAVACSHPLPATYSKTLMTPCGQFYDSSIKEISIALDDMYRNYESYLKLNQSARNWASNFDISSVKVLYHSLLKPKDIHLSQEDSISPYSLTTSSKALYDKYKKLLNMPGK